MTDLKGQHQTLNPAESAERHWIRVNYPKKTDLPDEIQARVKPLHPRPTGPSFKEKKQQPHETTGGRLQLQKMKFGGGTTQRG